MIPLGTQAPDFVLADTEGSVVRRTDFAGQPLLVMFICNHCPYVVHIRETLGPVTKQYMDRGIAVVGINSNDVENYPADSPKHMAKEKANFGYRFPYLFDETQEVAKAYSAACTPDLFLFDADHRLVYRGQFDASRPGSGIPVTGADLTAAVDALLAGQDPLAKQVPSAGCNIKWKPGNAPRYFG